MSSITPRGDLLLVRIVGTYNSHSTTTKVEVMKGAPNPAENFKGKFFLVETNDWIEVEGETDTYLVHAKALLAEVA